MCYLGCCGEYAGYHSESFILEYLSCEFQDKYRKIKEKVYTGILLPYTRLKIFFVKRSKIIDSIFLYDFDKENPGWSTSYKYEVRITFKKSASIEDMCKWLNFWFHYDRYGRYSNYRYILEMGSFKQIGNDKPFCFTKG